MAKVAKTRKKGKSTAPREQRKPGKQGGTLRAAFERHQDIAVDSLLRLISEPAASLLTWVVIGIALALPMCMLLLLQNLQNLGSGMDQNNTISLYLDKNLGQQEIQELQAQLSARGDIQSIEFISAEQALAEFEQESGFSDVLQGLDENPLPAVLLVTPESEIAEQISLLQEALQQQAGVQLAQLDLQWLLRLNAIVAFATRLALLLALLLGLGVVLAIGNTVRMAIENRRAEIVVVKLVGGTDAYVARPFLYTGVWYGVGGGVCALLIIYLSLLVLQEPVSRLLGVYNNNSVVLGPGLTSSFLLVLAAAALGWFGARISVLRHLRAVEPGQGRQ